MLLKFRLHQNQRGHYANYCIHCFVLRLTRVVYMKKIQDALQSLFQVYF